jgi:4-hydroxybenzoate polyprenyltransferase
MSTIVRSIGTTLEMIKIEHTLFALPFAFLGAVLAANGIPSALKILWITVAMVGARSTAMAFNRIADKDYDARNPRTRMRAIPAGTLSVSFVLVFTVFAAALFLLAAAMLNRLTLLLSPVALVSAFWDCRFALDLTRVAPGSIRGAGCVILRDAFGPAGCHRVSRHGRVTCLPAHAGSRG